MAIIFFKDFASSDLFNNSFAISLPSSAILYDLNNFMTSIIHLMT